MLTHIEMSEKLQVEFVKIHNDQLRTRELYASAYENADRELEQALHIAMLIGDDKIIAAILAIVALDDTEAGRCMGAIEGICMEYYETYFDEYLDEYYRNKTDRL